jgi:hypothetical protein
MPTLEPLRGGLHRERQAELGDRAVEVRGAGEFDPRRRRDARGLRKPLGAELVHAHGAAEHAAAGVRNAEPLERALQRAVLAARSMQRDPGAIETGGDELAERVAGRIEEHRVDAARDERLVHGFAGHQRDLALRRVSAHQHRDAAKVLRARDPAEFNAACTQTAHLVPPGCDSDRRARAAAVRRAARAGCAAPYRARASCCGTAE